MSERSPDVAAELNAWIAWGNCNPSVAKMWLEHKDMEVARTERLPASESLTVGEMIDLVTVLDRMRDLISVHPVIRNSVRPTRRSLGEQPRVPGVSGMEGHRLPSRKPR